MELALVNVKVPRKQLDGAEGHAPAASCGLGVARDGEAGVVQTATAAEVGVLELEVGMVRRAVSSSSNNIISIHSNSRRNISAATAAPAYLSAAGTATSISTAPGV